MRVPFGCESCFRAPKQRPLSFSPVGKVCSQVGDFDDRAAATLVIDLGGRRE
jgi:hypothetical protein